MQKLIIILTLFLAIPLHAAIRPGKTKQQSLYQKYLELKREVLKSNLANINRPGYIPKTVVLLKGYKTIVAPIEGPFKKVFDPKNPNSNAKGIVLIPNLDKESLMRQIDEVERELQALQ